MGLIPEATTGFALIIMCISEGSTKIYKPSHYKLRIKSFKTMDYILRYQEIIFLYEPERKGISARVVGREMLRLCTARYAAIPAA